MEETHDDVIRDKKLPRLGQTVRSKKYGTQWRIIEKKEAWQNTTDDPETGEPRLLPAIHFTYRKIEKGGSQKSARPLDMPIRSMTIRLRRIGKLSGPNNIEITHYRLED
jgi:hypothetical protein